MIGVGHAGQPRDLDAVALAGRAGDDAAQEDDVALPLAHRDRAVVDARLAARQVGQLVVVGGEQHQRPRRGIVQVLGHRPGDRDAVEGAGAAADLVEHDQAARR